MVEPTISKPNWATEDVIDPITGRINVQEPPAPKVEQGLARGDFIPRQWFNWLFRSCGEWITWLYSENEARHSETAALQYDLSIEAGFREAGDANEAMEREAAVSAEAAARAAAVSAEASTRATADSDLAGQLTDESATRSSHDSILEDLINSTANTLDRRMVRPLYQDIVWSHIADDNLEHTVASFTLKANTVQAVGDRISLQWRGLFGTSLVLRRFKVKVNGVTIVTLSGTGGVWQNSYYEISVNLMLTAADTVGWKQFMNWGGSNFSPIAFNTPVAVPAGTFAADTVVEITAQETSGSDTGIHWDSVFGSFHPLPN